MYRYDIVLTQYYYYEKWETLVLSIYESDFLQKMFMQLNPNCVLLLRGFETKNKVFTKLLLFFFERKTFKT